MRGTIVSEHTYRAELSSEEWLAIKRAGYFGHFRCFRRKSKVPLPLIV